MDNNKRLTPEEMLHRYEISTRYGGAVYLDAAINAMKLYAAQEGAAERVTIDELSRQINEFKDEMFEQSRLIIEKDALLKEANGIITQYRVLFAGLDHINERVLAYIKICQK